MGGTSWARYSISSSWVVWVVGSQGADALQAHPIPRSRLGAAAIIQGVHRINLSVHHVSRHLQRACRPTDRSEPQTRNHRMPVREDVDGVRQVLASGLRLEEIQASQHLANSSRGPIGHNVWHTVCRLR